MLAQIWRDTQESRAAARAIAAELWIHWSAWADWDSETSKAVPFDHHSVPDWYEEVPLSVLISDSRTWNEPVDPPPLGLDQTAWDTLRLPVMRVADREDLRKLAHWYGTVNGGSLASIDYRSAKELRRTLDETIESAERTIGSVPHTMWRTGSGGY